MTDNRQSDSNAVNARRALAVTRRGVAGIVAYIREVQRANGIR